MVNIKDLATLVLSNVELNPNYFSHDEAISPSRLARRRNSGVHSVLDLTMWLGRLRLILNSHKVLIGLLGYFVGSQCGGATIDAVADLLRGIFMKKIHEE
jgi:hypothetical protein